MVTITFISNGNKQVTAPDNSNLLRVSLREQGGIPFKCGGGICGTCKCTIESGLETLGALTPRERKLLTQEQVDARMRLACQTAVTGDIAVSWQPLTGAR